MSLSSEVKNLCTVCGVDMGSMNPRQYCYKTYCPEELDLDSEIQEIMSTHEKTESKTEKYTLVYMNTRSHGKSK